MEILYTHVGGIDVHKKQVTVTARIPDPTRPAWWQTTRTFRTFYADLLAMAGWLVAERGVTHVAMESTGPYWWPVYSALREVGGTGLTIEVVNAAHVKAVPGRKTDVKDSQWLAELMEVGLLRGSFLPPEQVRQLRDFTRYQTKLTEERSREKQRLLKVDPVVLADLARGVLRNKTEDLRLALAGRFSTHHGQMVGLHLARIDRLDLILTQVRQKIGQVGKDATPGLIDPFTAQVELLMGIPGIGHRAATVIISEIGVDMSRFPTAGRLAAWAGLAPGNNESAGKRRRGHHRRGNVQIQSILVEAALAAGRTRTRIGARFHRLHRRFGGKANPTAAKKAAFAVAHTLIKVAWTVLATAQPYQDLGHDFYTRRVDPETQTRRLIAQLEASSGKEILFYEPGDFREPGDPPPDPSTVATGLKVNPNTATGTAPTRPSPAKVRPQGSTTWSLFPSTRQLAASTTRRQAHQHAPIPRCPRLRRDAAAHLAKVRVSSQPVRASNGAPGNRLLTLGV